MILLPRRQIKRAQASKLRDDGIPAVAKVHRTGKDGDAEGSIDGVDAVVEEFAERTGLAGTPRLGAVAGIEGLVEEETDGPGGIDPRRTVLVKAGVVPEEGEEVHDDEAKTREGDEVRATRCKC